MTCTVRTVFEMHLARRTSSELVVREPTAARALAVVLVIVGALGRTWRGPGRQDLGAVSVPCLRQPFLRLLQLCARVRHFVAVIRRPGHRPHWHRCRRRLVCSSLRSRYRHSGHARASGRRDRPASTQPLQQLRRRTRPASRGLAAPWLGCRSKLGKQPARSPIESPPSDATRRRFGFPFGFQTWLRDLVSRSGCPGPWSEVE